MTPDVLATGFLIGVFFLLIVGLPVGIVLFVLSIGGIVIATSVDPGTVVATALVTQMTNWGLTALPLFVLMGELLGRSGLAARLFNTFSILLTGVPGGLVQTNVFACGLFSALSGSSTATVASIARISFGELRQRGYSERSIVGSIAGAGTLGILIPPSVAFILYGFVFNASISKLFLAGILPGLILMIVFCIYIAITTRLPEGQTVERVGLTERLMALVSIWPLILLIIAIFGSIYGGYATPTEAAVIGVVGALILGIFQGEFNWTKLKDSLRGAVVFNSALALVLAASAALQVCMAYTGVPRTIVSWIQEANMGTDGTLLLIGLILVILGCFMDGLSMIVLTGAILLPLVQSMQVDLIWFGVYVVLLVEMGLITPPIGFNLFVLQKATRVELPQLAMAALPYLLLLFVGVAMIWMIPGLATWLPSLI